MASGALTAVVSAEVERLRAQHADAVREKSPADSKCRKLAEKVAALEGERTDLRRQLAEERREANEAFAKAQSAQAEANLARVEGSLARQRAEEWEERFNALQTRVERVEARRARRLSGRANSLWTRTTSWARGPLTLKCQNKSPDFAASSGCRRSCWRSPPLWRALCPMPPWSPAKGR
jgi:chromosome segregation ATPase